MCIRDSFNCLPAVVILLHIFLWKESRQDQIVITNPVLDALEDHGEFSLFWQKGFELGILFFHSFVLGFELAESLRNYLSLSIFCFKARDLFLHLRGLGASALGHEIPETRVNNRCHRTKSN